MGNCCCGAGSCGRGMRQPGVQYSYQPLKSTIIYGKGVEENLKRQDAEKEKRWAAAPPTKPVELYVPKPMNPFAGRVEVSNKPSKFNPNAIPSPKELMLFDQMRKQQQAEQSQASWAKVSQKGLPAATSAKQVADLWRQQSVPVVTSKKPPPPRPESMNPHFYSMQQQQQQPQQQHNPKGRTAPSPPQPKPTPPPLPALPPRRVMEQQQGAGQRTGGIYSHLDHKKQ